MNTINAGSKSAAKNIAVKLLKNHNVLHAYVRTTWKLYQSRVHRRIYRRFQEYTMLSESDFGANLELCEQFRHVEGSVVECGVWRGGMIAGIATLFGDDRHYCIYDSFEGLPPAADVDTDRWGQSAHVLQQSNRLRNNNAAEIFYAEKAMKISGAKNVHIHKGWFGVTLPNYSYGPIAILRADGDFYESTMDIFKNLYKHVVSGGLIIIDDYYYWDGCAQAVHDFLSQNKLSDKVRQYAGYAYLERTGV